jgi:hypothetical protein
MSEIKQILDHYTAVWNESDSAKRRALIADIYAEDAYYANPAHDNRGLAGIEEAVTANYNEFVSKGFAFSAEADAETHHNAVRVPWKMFAPDGSTVAAVGVQFLVLNEAGKILIDNQFILQAPTA